MHAIRESNLQVLTTRRYKNLAGAACAVVATAFAAPAFAQSAPAQGFPGQPLPQPQVQPAPQPAAETAKSTDHGPHEGNMGVSLGLPAGGGPTVGVSYALTDIASLRLDLGLDISSTTPSTPAGLGAPSNDKPVLFGFSVEAGYRMYLWRAGSLHAFAQPGIFVSKKAARGDFDTLTTVAAQGSISAEYFFADQLSVSGATGVALSLSNAFKDVRFNTGTTALYANFYW